MSIRRSRNHVLVQHSATETRGADFLRTLFVTLVAASVFVTSAAGATWLDFAAMVRSNVLDGDALTASQSGAVNYKLLPPADSFAGRSLNILISGIDSRYDQGAVAYGDTDEHVVIHSDTTMLMHIAADRSHIEIVSIPRDLITDIPECLTAEGDVTEKYTGMFNSAFATAAVTTDITAGVLCTKATVEELTGLSIDGYVVVDFKGFQSMVDALGGVWYNVEQDIEDEPANLYLSAGCQRLNGVNALGYARARKSIGDGSDTGRMGRQQKLVSALFREVLSKNLVTDLPALLTFVKATLSSLYTSPNLSDLNTDVGLLISLSSIDRSRITFTTMPSYPAPWDANRVVENEEEADALWEALASDTLVPEGLNVTDGNGTSGVVKTTVTDSGQSTNTLAALPSGSSENDSSDTAGSTDLSSQGTSAHSNPAPSAPPAPPSCPPGN